MSEDVGKELLSWVRSALDDGLTVRVVTEVVDGPISLNKPDKGAEQKLRDVEAGIVSEFDLLDGDVRYSVSKSFLEEESYKALSQRHRELEQMAFERISANFELLKEFYKFAKSELGELRDEGPQSRGK